MRKSIIVIGVLLISACSPKLIEVTQADADRGASKYSGLTLSALNEGKSLYTQNCAECHGLKKPNSRTEANWNSIVPIMVKKLNQKMGKEVVDSKKQEVLLQYLVTMANAPKK